MSNWTDAGRLLEGEGGGWVRVAVGVAVGLAVGVVVGVAVGVAMGVAVGVAKMGRVVVVVTGKGAHSHLSTAGSSDVRSSGRAMSPPLLEESSPPSPPLSDPAQRGGARDNC